jgi:hypothetical protein
LNLADNHFVLPIHFIFIKSSIAHNNHTVNRVKSDKYVSDLLNKEFSIIQNHCKIILTKTIKNTTQSITQAHIVGVHALFLCNLKNSVAFHVNAFSLICFHNFRDFSISI